MNKKILKTKRKLISGKDFGKGKQGEFDYYNNFMNESDISDEGKPDNKNKSKSSGNERIISVLKGDEIITISTEKLSEFQKFIDCFNCLFYILNSDRYYLINPVTVEKFFENSDFHILYDLDFSTQLNEKKFRRIHNVPPRKNIKTIKEFCPFMQWYFDTDDHKYFYTALWSPNRVLKFNRLNDKNYGEYMNPKFDKCSNSRITKFYGPFGTGKSTLVYLFFKTISYVSNSTKSDNLSNDKNANKLYINLQKLISRKKSKITIKKSKNTLSNNIEVNKELKLNDSNEESISDSFKEESSIELEEKD